MVYFFRSNSFCIQTGGSLGETYNHCIDAYDESIISKELLKELKEDINECDRLLNGCINRLRKELTKQKKARGKTVIDHR